MLRRTVEGRIAASRRSAPLLGGRGGARVPRALPPSRPTGARPDFTPREGRRSLGSMRTFLSRAGCPTKEGNMRKLAMAALALALFAPGVRAAESAAEERKEAADATEKEMKQEGREAKAEMKQEGREAKAKMDRSAQKTRDQARETSQDAQRQTGTSSGTAMGEEKKHPKFEGKQNFDVDGKVQKVSENSITIQRDELPPATLMLSKNTKVELDGERASLKQLKPGQDVKASFNLEGQKPEAIEIKAKKTDVQKDASK
jgi:hypothetical protein